MATKAEIPEPVSITEVELGNKYLTGKMHDTVVDELMLGEFKKIHPLETNEFSEQTDNIEIASDLPGELVKEKDRDIFRNSEGECFPKSPSEANLGHEEASTIVEYSQADAVQKDLSEENGTPREENLLPNEFAEKIESIEADLEYVPVLSLSFVEEETKGREKQENFEPEEVGEANEALIVEGTETTELNLQMNERDLEKPQDIDEVKREENNTEENIEEAVQNMEEACNAESREKTTTKTVSGDESTISINGAGDNDLVGEETVEQEEGVLLEAASVLGVENESEKTEVYAEVQDGTETTCITEATDEKAITGHIKEEIVPSSHEQEDSREEIINTINTKDDSSEAADGDIEQAECSQTEIWEGYRTEKTSESSANDNSPPHVSDILDASIVKQEENLESGFKNLPQTEASPEDKNEMSFVSLSNQNSNDTEQIEVQESLKECEDNLKQNLEKTETGEILDTPIVVQESPLTEGESLNPNGASADKKRDEDISSALETDRIDEAVVEVKQNLEESEDDVKLNSQTNDNLAMMREETNRDFELKEENVLTCEEDSEQLLHINESGEILDASMAEREKNLQDQGKNLNEVENSTGQKRTDDSAEENVSEQLPVETKGNVENGKQESQDIEAVAPNAVNLDERIVQNLDETTEKEKNFEESMIEESDGAKTPEYVPIADDFKEEVGQNLDKTIQKEEPEELSKENQVQEMPECSEYTTEVVTPNTDNLEEEIVEVLDQTPRNVEEPEERTRENKVDETLKEETTYVINQSEDTEILSSEGPSTAEDKDYGEPEKEMQHGAKTTEVVLEDPVKDFQDDEKEDKSEIFEGSDTGGVSDNITRDQLQDIDEGDVRILEKSPEKEGNSEESFVEDVKVTEVLEDSKGNEETMHIVTSLEEGVGQNLEETAKQNSEEGILLEAASILSVEDENKKEEVYADNNDLTTEEVQDGAQTTSIGEVTDEELITEPIKEKTDPSSHDCEKDAKISVQEDSREEILNQIDTRDANLEAVEVHTEQAEKFEREVSRDAEAIAPPADSDEGDIQDLEETQEKEGNSEEISVEDDMVKKVPEDSEGNEVVMQISSTLDEGVSQNLGETLDKEETTEDSPKNDEEVLNEPEESENTESITPVVGNSKETSCQNLEKNIEDSSKEDDMVAMVLEDSEDSKAVTSVDGNQKENIQYFEETLVKEDNTEESSNKDNKAEDLDEAACQNIETFEEKEDNIEESSKQNNSAAIMPENSEGAEVVTQDAGNLEKGTGQNLEESLEKEDNTGEGPKQEIQTANVPENSDGAELVTLIASNLEETDGQNFEQNQEKEDDTGANEPENSESNEAIIPIECNLEEEAGQNLEETIEKEENTEQNSQQDDKVAYVPENSECIETVTSIYNTLEDGAGQNIEETIEKEENTEESSQQDDKVANVLENSEYVEDVTPIYSNLEEEVGQSIEETIDKQEHITELVTPNTDNLEEEIAQVLDQTPRNVEEPEETTYVINKAEDTEILSSEGSSTTEDKDYGEPEKEMQGEAKTTVIQDAEKEETNLEHFSSEVVSEDPVKDFQDDEKEEHKSEIFEGSDIGAGSVSDIITRDHIQDGEGDVHGLEKLPEKEGNTEESFVDDGKVTEVLENSKGNEEIMHIATSVEGGVSQNLEETANQNSENENKKAQVYAENNDLTIEEVQDGAQTTSIWEVTDEQVITEPIKEETDPSSHDCEKEAKISEQEDSREEILNQINTRDINLEVVEVDTEQAEKFEREVSRDAEAISPPADSDEEIQATQVLENSDSAELVTPIASNLEEAEGQNIEQNEEKEDDTGVNEPKNFESTEAVSTIACNLEEEAGQNLEENTEESSQEDDKVAYVPENSECI